MSDIPDGADALAARMAIAWEITKEIAKPRPAGSNDEKIKLWLTIYNEVHEGLKGRMARAKSR